ncbi:Autophagy-related protein 21 [Spathaspora sp. JA1]|nr:Autophagy-related protein 21 [Spathaspora sp. JA1]
MIVNDLSFNPDYSCISVSTSQFHKIFNCDPFGQFYSSSQETLKRSLSHSIEDTSELTGDYYPTSFLKMLFSTSLTIIVPELTNRLLKIYNLKQNLKICELSFPSNIIDVKLNRKRLLVILETGQIYIYDLSCVKLLKVLQVTISSEFIGDLSADDKSWLVLPISSISQQTDLTASSPSQHAEEVYFDELVEFTRTTSQLYDKTGITLQDIKDDSNGWVLVYDTINLKPIIVFQAHNSSIGRISISANENKIATASKKGTIIRVFNLRQEDKLRIKQVSNLRRGHNLAKINALSFNNDNQILGCGSETNTIHFFRIGGSSVEQQEEEEQEESHSTEVEDSDEGDTSRSSEDLNENLANLLISKQVSSTPPKDDSKKMSWFKKTKKLINNQYTTTIIKKLPYKDYFENLIWESPTRSFAYIKLPESNNNSKVEIGFNGNLVYLASYQTGKFYHFQLPKHRASVTSLDDDEKRAACPLIAEYSLIDV